ncbi:insulin-like_growth factor-binding protein [Hexamita inflata]|uniref:Insulin-like growth factor-binding protein n=1 Tax=Hexamita inflata TaxID=28002 RepID=A0AA86UK62_9EUKA|nr:insulin-like growth factor-binding protein [Hexamita inflata]
MPQDYASINKLEYSNVYRKVVIPPFVDQMPITELSVTNKYLCSYKVELQNAVYLRLKDLTIQNFVVARPQLIASFSQLSSLTLVGARIRDFTFIQHLTLKELKIQLASFSFEEKRIIAGQTGLQKLALNKCNFREVHLLQNIQLRELSLSGNKLKNSEFADCRFKHLQSLDVSFNLLMSLDYLVDLSPQLVGINASMNKIGKLFYNKDQAESGIEQLDISYNKLFDIQGLKLFPRLIDLNISKNKLGEKRMRIIQVLSLQKINIVYTLATSLNFINKNTIRHVEYCKDSHNYRNLSSFFTWPNLTTFKTIYGSAHLFFKHVKSLQHVKQPQLDTTALFYHHNLFNTEFSNVKERYQFKIKRLHQLIRIKTYGLGFLTSEINFLLMIMKTQNGAEQNKTQNVLFYNENNLKQIIKSKQKLNQIQRKMMQKQMNLLQIRGEE